MGRITTGIGLISGINSAELIDKLMAIEARPKTQLQSRIDQVNQQKLAYADLAARLTSLKLSATTLKRSSTFGRTSATSSNEAVLTATTSSTAAAGTYQLRVAQLVSSQQSVSDGFAAQTSLVGAGTLTIELGGGEIYSETPLANLNGGEGVRRGSFRITDRSGRSGVIDVSTAVTLEDVVRRINTSLDVAVRAEIEGNHIKLTDLTGQTAGNLIVADIGDGHTAADLGIAGTGASTLVGSDINRVGRSTRLSALNDGLGVRANASSADMRITTANGASYDISIGGLNTVGAVIDAINAATSGAVTASVAPDGNSLRLVDNTTGTETFAVTALNNSRAVRDLGLDVAAAGNTIDGRAILASAGTVLLSSLRGGAGLSLGKVDFTDRAGASTTIDFSGAATVRDIIDLINNNGVVSISARLKDAGNGIELSDTSGGSGNLVISDNDSTTAAELGIAGTFGPAVSVVRGVNLQRQWMNENTLLATLNGGKGVTAGKFKITNSLGQTATIDLSTSPARTVGDVIARINAATTATSGPLNVVASINATGDGILLTDQAGGQAKLKVEESGSTTAADLRLKGTAADTTIDGSFEITITTGASDTLADAVRLINNPGFAVRATIVNDGSGAAPYRLSLTARNPGTAGRFVFDAGDTALQTRNLVEARDAVVFFGGSGADAGLPIVSSTNSVANVINGVTLELHAPSTTPVTLTVTTDVGNVVSEIQSFVSNFNSLIDKLRDLTKYDSTTNTRGVLLGEGAVQTIEQQLYGIFDVRVRQAGTYTRLSDIGLSASGSGGKLQFDEDRFRAAWAADPESVTNLFSLYRTEGSNTIKGIGAQLEDRLSHLIDPVSGVITLQNKALDQRTEQFQNRIAQLDKLLAAKRTRLEKQFQALESVLAGLQQQQQAIANLSVMQPLRSSGSSSR